MSNYTHEKIIKCLKKAFKMMKKFLETRWQDSEIKTKLDHCFRCIRKI